MVFSRLLCILALTLTAPLAAVPALTETPTPTPTASITPTFTVSMTPNATQVAALRIYTPKVGPVPVKAGEAICLAAPAGYNGGNVDVVLLNLAGERVRAKTLSAGDLCLGTTGIAPGIYLARIGASSDQWQKIAIVP
jgi:hypothetical protein